MKKYRFITACLLILLAFLLFNIFNRNGNSTIETFNMDAATKEEITDELVIALFIEDITNVVTNFYSEYYSGEIAVYDYEIAIVDIEKKEPGFISVKLGVTPQVGAHNPLGYDELVYRVDSSGNKELVGYEHLKNFEVPAADRMAIGAKLYYHAKVGSFRDSIRVLRDSIRVSVFVWSFACL